MDPVSYPQPPSAARSSGLSDGVNGPPPGSVPATLLQLHQTYCQLTGQTLSLGFDRERLWFEFHRAGFTQADLLQVVRYLQKEIRHTRRNVGALKLSNLLQLDRFEEDLNISRVRLSAPPPPKPRPPSCRQPAHRRNRSAADNAHWSNCANSKKPFAKEPMPLDLSILEKLEIAHRLVAEALGRAPQLCDCRLDQAMLVLELSIKRARRSPQMRLRLPPDRREEAFLF